MTLKKHLFWLLVLSLSFWASSCQNDVQLPNKILAGQIDQIDWEFKIGKALNNSIQEEYIVELFDFTGFTDDEGCLLFGGNSRHISFSVPLSTQNGVQIQAPGSNLQFHINSTTILTADRGFIEISFINNTEIRGFISAGSSEENSVEGFFSVLICN